MGVAPRAPAEPHRCGTLDARERALLFADAFDRRYGAYTPRPNPRETGLIAQEARRSVPTGWQTESPPTPQQCATMGKIIAACDGSQVERQAMLVERLATPEGERLCAAMLCFAMCCPQLAPDAEPVETVEDECDNSPLEDECDAKKISQVHKLIIKLAQKSAASAPGNAEDRAWAEQLQSLLCDGAVDPNYASSDGTTTIMMAVAQRNARLLKTLLDDQRCCCSIDDVCLETELTAFHLACGNGDTACVMELQYAKFCTRLAWVRWSGRMSKRRRKGATTHE